MPSQSSIFDTPLGPEAVYAHLLAHGQASAHGIGKACNMSTTQAAAMIKELLREGKLVVVEADNEARRYWEEYRLAETEKGD